ncbi:hypothetical protein QQF64_009580 [Cirrhinus molitorella]|uniref:Uncharacterized protein n=1 Tax=Cirrhinus molitorella TaxID=172907 RepID=A0ABR3M1M2_9TELE
MRRESSDVKDSINHCINKAAFAEYIGLFPEGREAIRIKTENMDCPSSQHMSQQVSQYPTVLTFGLLCLFSSDWQSTPPTEH